MLNSETISQNSKHTHETNKTKKSTLCSSQKLLLLKQTESSKNWQRVWGSLFTAAPWKRVRMKLLHYPTLFQNIHQRHCKQKFDDMLAHSTTVTALITNSQRVQTIPQSIDKSVDRHNVVKTHNFAPRKQILALTTKLMNLESTVGNETKQLQRKHVCFKKHQSSQWLLEAARLRRNIR